MNSLFTELLGAGCVLTDGGWATEMQVHGLPMDGCPDEWNLERPERVEAVAAAYVDAGSAVILTNTFGANRYALARHGLADSVRAINRQGVEISRRAAGAHVRVFASVGPTGRLLADGGIEAGAIYDAFVEQTEALAEGRPDAIVIETMSDLGEAKLAVAAARATGLPVAVNMVYVAGPLADRTITGVTPEQAALELVDAGADAIGTNCGNGAADMLPICTRLRAVCRVPLWIKPNAGLPEMVNGRAVYHTTPDQFASAAIALAEAGADFIGGCCGTSPAYIRALRAALSASRT